MTQTIAVRRTFKYRLYRCDKKDKHLRQQIDIAGIIWNHCLALQKRYYRLFGGHISQGRLKSLVKTLRNGRRYAYWRKLGSQAIQDVIERLERAYQRFFSKQGGLPRFKKVKKYKSFTLKATAGWKLLPDKRAPVGKKRGVGVLRIGKIDYKFIKQRQLQGTVKTVTIKRDSCRQLWVCFSVLDEITLPDSKTDTVKIGGFDFGLRTFLVDHTGKSYCAPESYKKHLYLVRTLSKAVSRKVKGSYNRKKARWLLNRTHQRITDQRREFHYQLAHELLKYYDVLVFEDLALEGMKHLWGRKVSDLGFGQFLEIVTWVAEKLGKLVIKIDRFTPTTQCCSDCGHRQILTLKQRTFACENCGLVRDRDHNAALNILKAGASVYTKRGLRKSS